MEQTLPPLQGDGLHSCPRSQNPAVSFTLLARGLSVVIPLTSLLIPGPVVACLAGNQKASL